MTLGQLLRRMRAERGLTQARLARLAGTNQPTISLWENDRDRPTAPWLERLGTALQRPIVEREYLDVALPSLIEGLLTFGEVPSRGRRTPPSDLAVERGGLLVAAPLLLEIAQAVRTAEELLARWIHLAEVCEAGTTGTTATRDAIACKLMEDEIRVLQCAPSKLTAGYIEHPLDADGDVGSLQANLALQVVRPLLPRASISREAALTIGRFIPVPRQRFTPAEPIRSRDALDDPVNAAVMLLATASRFPSCAIREVTILDSADELTVSVESDTRSWIGPLHRAVLAVLHSADFLCLTPLGRDTWSTTIRQAVDELVSMGLLQARGPRIEILERFWSAVASHPNHRFNRGEKRVRAIISSRLFLMLDGEVHG
jgi:transcriptional regulator with XRE-family HTH domain